MSMEVFFYVLTAAVPAFLFFGNVCLGVLAIRYFFVAKLCQFSMAHIRHSLRNAFDDTCRRQVHYLNFETEVFPWMRSIACLSGLKLPEIPAAKAEGGVVGTILDGGQKTDSGEV